ncbi:MAG: hypothetical protein WCE90_10455 [Candidatus Zixiibacteriota bacterium]
MPENKEDKRIFLTPAGAMVVLICFFLPWLKVSCARTTRSFSGPQIGGIIWLVFVAAIAIIVAFFYLRRRKQLEKTWFFAMTGSALAFAAIFIKYVTLVWGQMSVFVRAASRPINFHVHIGAIGTLLGFVLAMIGAFFLKTRKRKSTTHLSAD